MLEFFFFWVLFSNIIIIIIIINITVIVFLFNLSINIKACSTTYKINYEINFVIIEVLYIAMCNECVHITFQNSGINFGIDTEMYVHTTDIVIYCFSQLIILYKLIIGSLMISNKTSG